MHPSFGRVVPAIRFALLALPLAGLAAFAVAEDAPAPRPADSPGSSPTAIDQKLLTEVQERSELMANLRHLCDEIGPRLTGSPNLEKANRWAADRMTAYGLANVRLEPWEIPVGWERGTVSFKLLEPNVRTLYAASAGWSPSTEGTITGPVVILSARTKADLAKYKGKLQNAVVMRGPPADVKPVTDTSYGPGAPRPQQPRPLPKREERPKDAGPLPTLEEMRAFRRELADFLKAEGVAAVITDSAKPHGLLVTTGSWREGDRGTPQDPLPTLYVAHEHYALLHRLASREGGPAPWVELTVSNKFVPGPVTVFNTVGEVIGSEKPDEYVVVGAHLDSWDLASGATDNGTGSSVVLEVARAVAALAKAGMPPKRTIRFVLFTGEEQGLHGSKQYVRRHEKEMAKTSAAVVHDTGTGKVIGIGLQGRDAIKDIMEPELESLKPLDGWKGVDVGRMGGTDHLSFESFGVPGFACRQDMDEYRFTHHTQSDTFDKAKEPNLVQGAQVLAVFAVRVANLPDLLPRNRTTPKPPEAKPDEPKADEPKVVETKKPEAAGS